MRNYPLEPKNHPLELRNHPLIVPTPPKRDLSWVNWAEDNCGYFAISLQLLIFAFADLKPIRPSKDISRRYQYRFYRLLPPIFAFFLYIRCHDEKKNVRLVDFILEFYWLSLWPLFFYFLSIDARYTLFILSPFFVCISMLVFELSESQFAQKYLYLCALDEGGSMIVSCFAFDMFLRLLFFSIYGYTCHYHPDETSKSSRLEWLP